MIFFFFMVNKMDEIILKENKQRFTIFPIKYPDIWELQKELKASFWTFEEIDFSSEKNCWDFQLQENDRRFISHVLAFFAAADGIVNENLASRFYKEVQIPEARSFYAYQIANEAEHNLTYSGTIDLLFPDNDEKNKLLNAVQTIPCVANKANWAIKWIESSKSFAERLVAFAIVEGVFFSSSFCSIFWLKKRGLMPGLTFSNELISRDENLHCEMACLLYSYLNNKLTKEKIYEIFDEAVEIECAFVKEALNVPLIGMNADLMCQYVRFCADRWIYVLGYPKKYLDKNPFDFMELISVNNKENFFERKVSNYQKAGVLNSDENKFNTNIDF